MNINTDEKYREQKKHGQDNFPIQIYHACLKANTVDLYLHWHDEYEIVYIKSGSAIYEIDLVQYPVKQGDILIINKDSLHSATSNDINGCECYTIVFSKALLRSFNFDLIEEHYFKPLEQESIVFKNHLTKDNLLYNAILNGVLKLIYELENNDIGYELIVKANLINLIALLYRSNHYVSNPKINLQNRKLIAMKTILAYIEEHYHEKISIKQLANLINYSEYYFIRFFKEETNMKCTEYINHIRLEKAHFLLKSTKLSISEIAYGCGYDNLSYFTKKYKEKYNCTPRNSKK